MVGHTNLGILIADLTPALENDSRRNLSKFGYSGCLTFWEPHVICCPSVVFLPNTEGVSAESFFSVLLPRFRYSLF